MSGSFVRRGLKLIVGSVVLSTILAGSAGAATGDVLWVRTSGRAEQDYATHMVVRGGFVYVAGYWCSFDFPYPCKVSVFKYSAGGARVWAQDVGPVGTHSISKGIALDPRGNVFVLAHHNDAEGNLGAYLTAKLDGKTGKVLWTKTITRRGDESWSEEAIAADSAGNVYVAGSNLNKTVDYLVVSYGPGGKQRWRRAYNGPAGGHDRAQAIVVEGNAVYVAGFSWGGDTMDDWAILRYTTNGSLAWVRRLDAGYRVTKAVVDAQGDVVVAGTRLGPSVSNDEYLVARYSANGKYAWSRRYGGPGGGNDVIHDVATDAQGSVYVTGHSPGKTTGQDFATIAYDSAGGLRWIERYSGAPGGEDVAFGVVASDTGDVYVTGKAFSGPAPKGYFDYYTLKYNQAGKRVWVRRYNRKPEQEDAAAAIGIDSTGVYVTGGAFQNMTTIKYER
jgi:hypothetical protein